MSRLFAISASHSSIHARAFGSWVRWPSARMSTPVSSRTWAGRRAPSITAQLLLDVLYSVPFRGSLTIEVAPCSRGGDVLERLEVLNLAGDDTPYSIASDNERDLDLLEDVTTEFA